MSAATSSRRPSSRLGGATLGRRSLGCCSFIAGAKASRNTSRARQVAALGCVCLTFDLSGHGATHSQWTTVSREMNFHDVLAAYDLLASRTEVDGSAMAVVGSSYGGYLGAILTAERPVRWLAMRVPALYYDDGWELPKQELHDDFDLSSYRQHRTAAVENRALRACAAFPGDVLLVESEHDEIVPHPAIQSYREACAPCCSLSHEVIQGADHGLTDPRHQDGIRVAAGPVVRGAAQGRLRRQRSWDPMRAKRSSPDVR